MHCFLPYFPTQFSKHCSGGSNWFCYPLYIGEETKAQVLPTCAFPSLSRTPPIPQPSQTPTPSSLEVGLHGDRCMHLTLFWNTVPPFLSLFLLGMGLASGGQAASFSLECSLPIPLSSRDSLQTGPNLCFSP